MVRNKRNWTDIEIAGLEKFIISNKFKLENLFYQNIIAGKLSQRKSPGFFNDMSLAVNRSPDQCKSKFQKFERKIYRDFLKLPEDHYRVFIHIRKKKSHQNKKKNENLPLRLTRKIGLLNKSQLSEDLKILLPKRYLSKIEKKLENKTDSLNQSDNSKMINTQEFNEEELEDIRLQIIKDVESEKIKCGIDHSMIGKISLNV